MSITLERYVFFNNAASRDELQAGRVVAIGCGARVVGMLPRALMLEVEGRRVPDIAALLVDWRFTPDRRRMAERRLSPARRALAEMAHQGSPT